ncbi:NAD-binding protein [Phyllobacterium pellucidum]|uniref:NAD-binding protein n=1 Tax=Phyllobacterium pellucidum TaxID=2740464 RepID=UPI00351CDC9C
MASSPNLAGFNKIRRLGHTVVHGDAAHRRILSAARLAKARLVVITIMGTQRWNGS